MNAATEPHLISVIIPAYNAEHLIEACLKSLQIQSYRNFETIIIENGSTDNTYGVVEIFASQDSRFRLFHNEEKGAARARNFGIDKSNGFYLTFIDADDFVEPDYLSKLANGFFYYNTSMVCCSIIGYIKNPHIFYDLDNPRQQKKALEIFDGSTVCKLYKRDFIGSLRYDLIPIGEDPIFNMKVLSKKPKIQFIRYDGYHYIYNPTSITATYDQHMIQSLFNRNAFGFDYIFLQSQIDNALYGFWQANSIHHLLICVKRISQTNMAYFKECLKANRTAYLYRHSTAFFILEFAFSLSNSWLSRFICRILLHVVAFKKYTGYATRDLLAHYAYKIFIKTKRSKHRG